MRPDIPSAKAERTCPRCGLVFFAEKLDGMCPSCLLSHSLDGEDLGDGPAFWEDAPEKPFAPARTFSHFELLDELGRGGMGVVYRARDLNTERIVALKVLQAHHLDVPDLVQRFRSEVRAVSSLDHPYVLPIHEVGEHDGIPFFSMKLTTAGSLAQSIGNYRGKPRESAQLLAKVARGVQHAHERGILHRDLKPGNILLDAAGEPYVCDFGLAKWIDSDQKLTVTSAVLGTPHYIAPEQALGSKALTTAVDIYSLGAILYELLTGRPPFLGATVLETLVASQEKTPDRPSSIAKNVPADLETICLKALEHDPSSRYATAGAFADDLENWLAGRAITARPVSAAEQLWRWAKRNPLPAFLMAALLGTLTTLAIGSTMAAIRIEHERREATHQLYLSLLAQGRSSINSGRAGQRFDALQALGNAAKINSSQEVRDEAIAALALLDLRIKKKLVVRHRGQVPPSFDDRLEHFIAEDNPGEVQIVRTSDGSCVRKIGDSTTPIEFITQSNFKKMAVRHVGDIIKIWDLETGKKLFELAGRTRGSKLPWLAFDFVFSPDSQTLAVSSSEGGFNIYKTDTGQLLQYVKLDGQPNCISFSPTGRYIASSLPNSNKIAVWDANISEVHYTILTKASVHHLTWSPDEKYIGFGCTDFNIYVHDLHSGVEVATFIGHRLEPTQLVFSHHGDLLASTGRDKTVRLWSLQSLSQEVVISGVGGEPSLKFSSDDKFLSSNNFNTDGFVLELGGTDRVCSTLVASRNPGRATLAGSVDVSPSGTMVVTASWEAVDLWNVSSGEHIVSLKEEPGVEKSARFGLTDDVLLISSRGSGLKKIQLSKNGAYKISVIDDTPGFIFSNDSAGNPRYLGLTSSETGVAKVIDLQTMQTVLMIQNQARIWDIGLDPSMRYAALSFFTVNSAASGNVKVWSIHDHRQIAELDTGPSGVARFTPDGRFVLTTGVKGSAVWEVGSWKQLKNFGNIGNLIAPFPDGNFFALSEDQEILLISLLDYKIVARLQPPLFPSGSHRLAFIKNPLVLVAQGADNTVRIWDIEKLRKDLRSLQCDWQ